MALLWLVLIVHFFDEINIFFVSAGIYYILFVNWGILQYTFWVKSNFRKCAIENTGIYLILVVIWLPHEKLGLIWKC